MMIIIIIITIINVVLLNDNLLLCHYQSSDSGASSERWLARSRCDKVGHCRLSSHRLPHLLLLPVEGHFHIWQGRLVHCTFSLRRSLNTSSPGCNPAWKRRGHQVLSQSQFFSNHESRGESLPSILVTENYT